MMVSTSSPSEKMSSFRLGSTPFSRHQARIFSPPSIGGALSGRKPVQSATQSGASRRKAAVPNASGSATSRLPP